MVVFRRIVRVLIAGAGLALFAFFVLNNRCTPSPPLVPDGGRDAGADGRVDGQADAGSGSAVIIENRTDAATAVFIAFGADSKVTSSTLGALCGVNPAPLNCTFALGSNGKQRLPIAGAYFNATFSFGAAVTCGVTKAELNINNPKWYDIADISLVDGFNGKIAIAIAIAGSSLKTILGPPVGKEGNEKVFGVYPYGCDICVARLSPPCGISKGKDGCKSGTQYNPAVPCQYQGTVMGGGAAVYTLSRRP